MPSVQLAGTGLVGSMNQVTRNRSRAGGRAVQRALGHLDERVGPRHLGVTVVEQGITGLGERGVDDAAVVGVEVALEAVAAVVVEVGLTSPRARRPAAAPVAPGGRPAP